MVCCSDSAIKAYTKNSGCPVWAESSNINGHACIHAATWEQAKAHCEADGARLCTQEELSSDCAKNTGCDHHADMVWSSTTCGQTTAGPCPSGWSSNNGHCYAKTPDGGGAKTWQAAQSACELYGAHLVTINDQT